MLISMQSKITRTLWKFIKHCGMFCLHASRDAHVMQGFRTFATYKNKTKYTVICIYVIFHISLHVYNYSLNTWGHVLSASWKKMDKIQNVAALLSFISLRHLGVGQCCLAASQMTFKCLKFGKPVNTFSCFPYLKKKWWNDVTTFYLNALFSSMFSIRTIDYT